MSPAFSGTSFVDRNRAMETLEGARNFSRIQIERRDACRRHALDFPSGGNCGKKKHVPNPFKSTVMNESNANEMGRCPGFEGERETISIVRETEIERPR